MTLSLWRYAHLVLAFVTTLVLVLASLTGIVLAVDVAYEKTNPYQTTDFNEVKLVQSIPQLQQVYPEISKISVDHNQFVILEGFDSEGDAIKAYINPLTGAQLGIPKPKNKFIQWNLALHRSLFLHETGRFIIGLASFLFFLIAVSGTVLLIKRQKGIKNFFSKVGKDSLAQYVHVVLGKYLLLPILIIALSGTYLFLVRFEILPSQAVKQLDYAENPKLQPIPITDFEIFKTTKLADVVQLEFPFMPDDPEEFFLLKLKDRELTVHQITGQIVKETTYPVTKLVEQFSFALHTGQINWIWALVLAVTSVSILLFIYSGFAIFLKRTKTRIQNKFKPETCEYILLVGSENGSTLGFANKIHQQLWANGKRSYLTDLNNYKTFSNAKQLVVFTSTYGLGEAPFNAAKFEKLVNDFPQHQKVGYSVVGFGSQSYPDFCAFAYKVEALLAAQPWAEKTVPLHTVNDKSAEEFAPWVLAWSAFTNLALATAPALYRQEQPKLKTFQVVGKAALESDGIITFKLNLKPKHLASFQSGDLLAIYPKNDSVERFYSIGKVGNTLQLIVRLHPKGVGSEFLYQLEKGATLQARIIKNPHFHFPKKAPQVALISNGTGIAPFLGMLSENKSKVPTHLYCGFRTNDALTQKYAEIAKKHIVVAQLTSFHLALSREATAHYVMDLINSDQNFFLELLRNKGVVLICGSLSMQKDVEAVLTEICAAQNESFEAFKANGQVLADCY